MKYAFLNEKLELEKEKLSRLVEEALEKDIPLNQDKDVMEQNIKVDDLVIQLQKIKERQRQERNK